MNEEQMKAVKKWRGEGLSYPACAFMLKREFGLDMTRSAVRHAAERGVPAKPKDTAITAAITAAVTAGGLNDRILTISDLHIPYHHQDSIAFLTALKAKYKPTRIVCGGDEVDHHAMSFHDADPDLPAAGDELKKAIEHLQPLFTLFPVMDLLESNHGSMAYRKGKHHGMPRSYFKSYGEVLGSPKGWVWHPELSLDLPDGNTCYFHHGITKDVMKVVMLRGLCVVQFHFHTEFKIGYIGNPQSLLWGMSSGCLIDRQALAFAYDNLNLGRPVIGTSIIIDGQPKLLPMILNKNHRWSGFVP